MAEWKFDEGAAHSAGGSGAILESGVYYGVFTEAKLVSTPNGARGVEFSFEESDTGRQCRYIRVITRKNDGDKAFGYGLVNALMGLLKLTAISDAEIGEDSNGQPVRGLPALCDKPVGVMLQREDYWKSNGTPGWRMNVVNFIDAVTNKTFAETKDGKDATAYKNKIVDRPAPPRPGAPVGKSHEPGDDDLPF